MQMHYIVNIIDADAGVEMRTILLYGNKFPPNDIECQNVRYHP
jgi:hypothetical protein